MSADRLARAALCQVFEPGDPRLPVLLREYGPVRLLQILRSNTDPRLHSTAADVGPRLARIEPERTLERAARAGIRFVTPEDDEWPTRLGDLDEIDPLMDMKGEPVGLWVRGGLRLDRLAGSVAVVGARNATTYGSDVAARLAAEAALAGRVVVSGGAFGIDRAAHCGALAVGAPTVAVLACGVDQHYPLAHAALLNEIAESGAVISELAPEWRVTRLRFLSRNRIIAAASDGVVVVEAAIRSGALNTASWGERLSRHVMGVPGPITSAQSQGVHQLLRRGGTLVSTGGEVMESLSPMGTAVADETRAESGPRDRVPLRAQRVLDALDPGAPMSIEDIGAAAAVAVVDVANVLRKASALGLVEYDGEGWLPTETALRTSRG